MQATNFKCPNCGASFDKAAGYCEYCKTYLQRYKGPPVPPVLAEGMYFTGTYTTATPYMRNVYTCIWPPTVITGW